MMGLTITDIPFIGYPVSDMKRAREFYEGILGLKPGEIDHEIQQMPGKYWVEYEIGSQTLANLQRMGSFRPKRPIGGF